LELSLKAAHLVTLKTGGSQHSGATFSIRHFVPQIDRQIQHHFDVIPAELLF
jgi:hypothetical protein